MKIKLSVLAGFIILIDLATKTIVQNTMELYQSIDVIEGFFSIMYLQNTGAAWSILEGQKAFFIVVSSAVCTILLKTFIKEKEDPIILAGLALMFAGAFGNLFDRVVHGYVRDMLAFNIFGYDFPVFNIADVSLVIGVGLIALAVIIEERRSKSNA